MRKLSLCRIFVKNMSQIWIVSLPKVLSSKFEELVMFHWQFREWTSQAWPDPCMDIHAKVSPRLTKNERDLKLHSNYLFNTLYIVIWYKQYSSNWLHIYLWSVCFSSSSKWYAYSSTWRCPQPWWWRRRGVCNGRIRREDCSTSHVDRIWLWRWSIAVWGLKERYNYIY